ncbi:hypothetical protein [Kitasatospora sp. NPDC096140]|uniref:hypothetical protein n=1 Tax=Kitasatospora sp. NPDC096140 TaxID=3155425 RepID=UPI003316847C
MSAHALRRRQRVTAGTSPDAPAARPPGPTDHRYGQRRVGGAAAKPFYTARGLENADQKAREAAERERAAAEAAAAEAKRTGSWWRRS